MVSIWTRLDVMLRVIRSENNRNFMETTILLKEIIKLLKNNG